MEFAIIIISNLRSRPIRFSVIHYELYHPLQPLHIPFGEGYSILKAKQGGGEKELSYQPMIANRTLIVHTVTINLVVHFLH